MSNTTLAIASLFCWYLVILMMLAGLRTTLTLGGSKAANQFAADGSDLVGFGQRLTRVHANNYENLPIFLALLIYAQLSGQQAVTDPLATVLVGARIAQGAVHMISVNVPAVFLRFGLFGVQLALVAWWTYGLFFA